MACTSNDYSVSISRRYAHWFVVCFIGWSVQATAWSHPAEAPSYSLAIHTVVARQMITLHFSSQIAPYRWSARAGQMQIQFPASVQAKIVKSNRLLRWEKGLRWDAPHHQLTIDYAKSGHLVVVVGKKRHQIQLHWLSSSPAKHHSALTMGLHVRDISAGELLRWLVHQHGESLVLNAKQLPVLTLEMKQQPWEAIFHAILRSCNLVAWHRSHTWFIETRDQHKKEELARLAERKIKVQLMPLVTQTLAIRYANAQQLAKLLTRSMHQQLIHQGSILADPRTNTLIIHAPHHYLPDIVQLAHQLDAPVREVAIASRMVTVTSNASKELGVRWQAGSSAGLVEQTGDQLNINLPVTSAMAQASFKIAHYGSSRLDLELSALEQEHKGRIIASPRITTANRHSAYIAQGREIPYVESASSGATSVTYKKAELSLKVTPQITPDNGIILDLLITQNNAGDEVNTGTGKAVAINTQEIRTQVLLHNGQTIVLGGIYQQRRQKSVSKVPLLGDIPAIGGLFRHTSTHQQKNELLIFVTPKIVASPLNPSVKKRQG